MPNIPEATRIWRQGNQLSGNLGEVTKKSLLTLKLGKNPLCLNEKRFHFNNIIGRNISVNFTLY